jgi:hypothetical protein
MEDPDNPGEFTQKEWLGLIARNGGAAVDACFASWLHLDGVQAYVLSARLQYLLLACCGLWLALQMGLTTVWLLIPAIASLWPSVILPSLVDNRDQTYGFILLFVLLGSSTCGGLNRRICGIALGALTFAYLEIVPVALFLLLAFRLDERPWRAGLKRVFVEGLIALLITLPLLPFNISYLLGQLGNRVTQRLEMPLGNLLGPLSPISGAFAGVWFEPSQVLPIILSISAFAFLAFQVLGLARWLTRRRFFSTGAFVALATLACALYANDFQYVAYKFLTALFPVSVLLCATALSPFEIDGRSLPSKLLTPRVATFLAALCIPALALGAAMRSGFTFSDLATPFGIFSILEDRQALAPQNGLRVRNNDVLIAKERARKAGKSKGVALSNFTRDDVSYMAHFLRSRKSWLLNGIFYHDTGDNLFSENLDFLPSGGQVRWLFLLNSGGVGVMRYDGLENLIWLRGQPENVLVFRSFTSLRLNPELPFAFAQRLYSQYWQEVFPGRRMPQTGFSFGRKGIAFGVYALNTEAKPSVLQFEIACLRGDIKTLSTELASWVVLSNFDEAHGFRFQQLGDRVFAEIPLNTNSAGHVIELGPRDRIPISASAFAEQPQLVTANDVLYELTNIQLIPQSVESSLGFPVTSE